MTFTVKPTNLNKYTNMKTAVKKTFIVLISLVAIALTIHYACIGIGAVNKIEQSAIDSTKNQIDTVQVITSNTVK